MKKIIYLILIPLLLITTVQICLRYPMTREIFTDIEIHEGLKQENTIGNQDAVLEIELNSGTPNKKIEILYNSEFIGFLDTRRVSFFVPCDGVVQIKNMSGENIGVDINYNPEKLIVKNTKKEITSGIQTLCTVNYRRTYEPDHT